MQALNKAAEYKHIIFEVPENESLSHLNKTVGINRIYCYILCNTFVKNHTWATIKSRIYWHDLQNTASSFQEINEFYLWALYVYVTCSFYIPVIANMLAKDSLYSKNVHSCQYILQVQKSIHLCPNNLFQLKKMPQTIKS